MVYSQEEIRSFILEKTQSLKMTDGHLMDLVIEVVNQLPDKISQRDDELMIALANALGIFSHRRQGYSELAAKIMMDLHDRHTNPCFVETVTRLQENKDIFKNNRPLLSSEFFDFIIEHKDTIKKMFSETDASSESFPMTLFGWKTIYRSYLQKTHDGVAERISHMWFRVALFLHRDDWLRVKDSFVRMKRGEFIHATPTLYHAGCKNPQMASCFVAGTPVLTSIGYKPIESVQIGDMVLTHNHVWKRVTQTHANPRYARTIFQIKTFHKTQKKICCTEDHKFYVYNKIHRKLQWKAACDLTSKDFLLMSHSVRLTEPSYTDKFGFVKGIMLGSYLHQGFMESTPQNEIVVRSASLQKVEKVFNQLGICTSFLNCGYTSGRHFVVRLLDISSEDANMGTFSSQNIYDELIQIDRKSFKKVLDGMWHTGIIEAGYVHVFHPTKLKLLKHLLDIHDIHYTVDCFGMIRLVRCRGTKHFLNKRYNNIHMSDQRFVRFSSRKVCTEYPENITVYTLGVEDDHSYFVGQLAVKNCFLVGTDDSVNGIFRTISHAATISKYAGGLGIHISDIRCKNSYIYGTNGFSNGIMPMLKVYNDTSRYIDQCFDGTTEIITSRGVFPISSIECGDEVLTIDGTFKKVTNKLIYPGNNKRYCCFSRDVFGAVQHASCMTSEHCVFLEHNGVRAYKEMNTAPLGSMSVFVHPIATTDIGFTVAECYLLGYIWGNCNVRQNGNGVYADMRFLDTLESDVDMKAMSRRLGLSFERHDDGSVFVTVFPTIMTPLPLLIDIHSFGTGVLPTKWLHIPFVKFEALINGIKESPLWDMQTFLPFKKYALYRLKTLTNTSADLNPRLQSDVPAFVEPSFVYDLCVDTNLNYQTVFGLVHNGGGKRNGAFAMYIEPWHADIYDFLFARRSTGNEEERARDLFYGLWVPDLFMRRVEENGDWCLMSPNECPGLNDCYGEKFDTLYTEYEQKGMFLKKIRARDLWGEIIRSQIETGVPYMLYKDTCNSRSNQKNLGTIRSSNLCCEIIEYSDSKEYAVCNLASISLPKMLMERDLTGIKQCIVLGKKTCSYCLLVKYCLTERGVKYKYIEDTTGLPEHLLEVLFESGQKTYPFVFVNDKLIGGFNELWVDYLQPRFDFQKLGEVVATITKNLNLVIDKNAYPLEECRRSNMKNRPIGIGVQGLADVFFIMKVSYDSEEARILNREIFECIYYNAIKTSCELSRVHGRYSSFDGSPISQGLFHFDMYPKETKRPFSGKYEWDTLREDIHKHGVRNSLFVAPMPTASTSQILGNTESFEPLTSNLYLRRTSAGEFYVSNRYLIKDLEAIGLWNNETVDSLILHKGSVQYMDIPFYIKQIYRTVWEIPQKSLIDMAADRQFFIDQSQSFNIYLNESSLDKLTRIHFYGWKSGLKTGSYYVRVRAPLSSQNFTIDPMKEREILRNSRSTESVELATSSCESCSA